eukprot:Gb_17096 [translate_table: standard]
MKLFECFDVGTGLQEGSISIYHGIGTVVEWDRWLLLHSTIST